MLSALFAIAVLTGPGRADAFIARGDFDGALRVANHAAPGDAEQIRGAVAEARDQLSDAAQDYERALRIAESTGDSSLMAKSAEGLTRMYGQLGRSDLCLAVANRMLEKDPAHRALYLFERGVAASGLNDPTTAWQSFEEALRLAQSGGDLGLTSQILRQRGLWIWRFRRDLPAALHEYDLALDDARRASAWRNVVLTLINYGNVLRNQDVNRLPEALQRYQEGLAIAEREHLSFQIAFLLKNMGDVYRQQGNVAAAETVLNKAMTMADAGNIRDVRWMARNQMGMLLRVSDPKRAEQFLREALAILESEQHDVLLADFRTGALADSVRFTNPYDQLVDLLISEGRAVDAFVVAEQERARVFLDMLSTSRESIARAAPASFADSERQLIDRIKTAQALLRTEDLSDQRRSELVASVGRFESRLSDLRLELAVANPSLANARYPRLWSSGELQSKILFPDESLVSFYLGGTRSVAWVLTPHRLTAVELPPAKTIERDAHSALDALRNPIARDPTPLAALGRDLQIDAIERLATGGRLVIVPHGVLHDVPFDALAGADGRMLVQRFAISYAPSASSLAFLRSLQRPARQPSTTLLVVADPVVGSSAATTARQADLGHLNLLAPLPRSGDEARKIAQLFGEAARVLEGRDATRAALRIHGAESASILHFATHGLIDETRPDRSGLVLTADPPRDDGLLQVRDIYKLHLDADLVTLSACETALGQNVTGEGIVGLTRAFFFAGARSVVASLWDVDDASTSDLMQRFYANIRAGQPIDLALQHAKIDFVRQGKPPFYWAAFVVSGNARTIVSAQPASPRWSLWAMVTATIAGAYFWIVSVRGGDTAIGRP